MHPSSMNNMQKAKDQFVGMNVGVDLKILDVGGRGLTMDNRSYYQVWHDRAEEYLVADINDGPGVTHIMPGPYTLPWDDDHFDLIVSGQTLEHVNNPFRSVAEMKRVLKPDGYIILIAPSSGPTHDNPDCWRFQRDSFKAIANEVGLKIVADWIDYSAPDERSRKWADHVFVGKK